MHIPSGIIIPSPNQPHLKDFWYIIQFMLSFKQAFIEVIGFNKNRKTALKQVYEVLNAWSANMTYKEVEQRFNDFMTGIEIARYYELVEEEHLIQIFYKD
jgi:hypothetical protein